MKKAPAKLRHTTASCYRSGQIVISSRPPKGTIPLISGPLRHVRNAIMGEARLAYSGRTWLVPGLPEAADDRAAETAYIHFRERLQAALDAMIYREIGGLFQGGLK